MKTWTFSISRSHLKLGPITFAWFRWFNGVFCVELHCMNRLIVAVPDWRRA